MDLTMTNGSATTRTLRRALTFPRPRLESLVRYVRHLLGESQAQMSDKPGPLPRAIGFWKDPDLEDDRFRHPIAFADPAWRIAERQLVADYLRSGHRTDSYMGYSWCRFGCGIDSSEMGTSDLSDGVWLWPEGLPHYVLEHAVRLPEDFLRHVRRQGGKMPQEQPVARDDRAYDLKFWIEWCTGHVNPDSGYREIEASEREAAVLQEKRELFDFEVQRLEDRFGVSEQTCTRDGCQNGALVGQALCAQHAVGDRP